MGPGRTATVTTLGHSLEIHRKAPNQTTTTPVPNTGMKRNAKRTPPVLGTTTAAKTYVTPMPGNRRATLAAVPKTKMPVRNLPKVARGTRPKILAITTKARKDR